MRKKSTIIITTFVLSLFMATVAFAATYTHPSEMVANLTGKTQDEVFNLRSQGKTYGQIAQENGVLEQFKNNMLEYKKAIIDERVNQGLITKENGEAIKKALEERIAICNGTPDPNRMPLGQQFGGGLGFGRGQGRGMGMGRGMGFGANITK
ncbi:MAG: hypothetical protein PWQ67_612 [Clostridia bacterium]|jgi:hypothetical protein|nr:hypothetical protein [Clostridia bacterium]MDN5322158.1 hypothetical protein [Clostridia bacterium]